MARDFIEKLPNITLNERVSAKAIADAFISVVGGKGGGKESKVEGGGKDPSKIQEGFGKVVGLLGG